MYNRNMSNTADIKFYVGRDTSGGKIFGSFQKTGNYISCGHVGSGHASYDEGAFVTNLIQDYSADELKFIMIDPKYVQLTAYNGIPHLLRPVINTPEEAKDAVDSLLREMESRLDLLAKAGVENVVEYNQTADIPLPFIVLLIPEIADLMMVDGEYYTNAFRQTAMKSRAVGMHMYLGTQRPSSDVLPDTLLVHIFGRLVFGVASEADSDRLISGYARADQIKKTGELYYMDQDMQPIKLQAAFISNDQIKSIVKSVIEAS